MFVQTESHDYASRFCTWCDLLFIQLATPSANASCIRPSPLQRDVGVNQQGVGGGETRGGTHEVGGPSSASRKRATTNVVARFLPFLLPSLATNACYTQAATTTSLASKREPEVVLFIVSTRLPPPPPPSRPNASRRWSFSFFQPASHNRHLPRVQTRAGGGFFRSFDPSPTTTSLASKREPEVVSFVLPTRLPPPPPPSRSNASWRWFFRLFRPSATTTTSLVSKRELEVVSSTISTACHHTTSLAFKRKLEVVFFCRFDRLPPLPPPSHPNASRRWSFLPVSMRLRMIGRDTRRVEGQGVTTTCSSLSLRALINKTPSHLWGGFLLWPRQRGGVHITRRPIRFFSLSVVNNMYLGYIL